MLFRLRRTLETRWFDVCARQVFETCPVEGNPRGSVIFVSQVCHRDLAMYLLAIKSLARFVRPRKVFVLDDLSLTRRDKDILSEHIRPIEIIPLNAAPNDTCPKGGCWERLLLISDKVQSSYVVQIDSDTLTLEAPHVVRKCIENNISFTLGEWRGQDIVCAQEAAKLVNSQMNDAVDHVQMIAEANLHLLSSTRDIRYVRGSAGFAGFGKLSFSRQDVERFSRDMAQIVGTKKWSEWGSEQVTSNYLVANSPNAEVLPFPEYSFHSPGSDLRSVTLVHFIGSHRFYRGRYARLARRVIRQLS